MKHQYAIKALIQAKDAAMAKRNEAMRAAGLPFNEEIKNIDAAIAALQEMETRDDANSKNAELSPDVTKRKRGRPLLIEETDVYPQDATIQDRLRFILRDAGRLLTMSEVAGRAEQFESKGKSEDWAVYFGRHVARYQKKGLIKSIGKGRDKRYGLPGWFDGIVVKNQYMPVSPMAKAIEQIKNNIQVQQLMNPLLFQK